MRLDRKTFGRVATAFVATAMLAAFAAVPAMAAEPAANEFVIPKTFTAAAYTFRPAATFRFNVEAANVTAEENGYYNGVAGAVTLKTPASFAAETATPSETPKSTEADAIFEVKFGEGGITHAGTYKYTLTEDRTSPVAGVTYDTNTYDLYIVVVNDDTETNKLKVSSWFMTKQGVAPGDLETKVAGITNTYATLGQGAKNLTVKKEIEGSGADKSAQYEFVIKVNSSSTTTTKYYYTTTGGDTGVIESGNNGATVMLSDDEKVTVYGLLDNDTYEISETVANQNQYTTKVKMEDDTQYTDYVSANDMLSNTMGQADTNGDNSVDITVQNNRELDDIPSTGVLLTVAPYALMVIIAVAAAFVFLRKRRDD